MKIKRKIETKDAWTQTDPVKIIPIVRKKGSRNDNESKHKVPLKKVLKKAPMREKKISQDYDDNTETASEATLSSTQKRPVKKKVVPPKKKTPNATSSSKQQRRRENNKKKTPAKKKTSTARRDTLPEKEPPKKQNVLSRIETSSSLTANQAKEKYKAVIHMFAGCEADQKSKSVVNVGDKFFPMHHPNRKYGGACTSALLSILWSHQRLKEELKKKSKPVPELTYGSVLKEMRALLQRKGYEQNPQLTSTRPFKMYKKFDFLPDGILNSILGAFVGKKRALLIGIQYHGDEKAKLNGCHDDVKNWKTYLTKVHKFERKDITVLADKDECTLPTKKNILEAYKKIVKQSKRGDVVFCHYSGHGARVSDVSGGNVYEAMLPLDYRTHGKILDEELNEILCQGFKKGVHCTFVYDCCHSNSMLDLPFAFQATSR